MGTGTEVFSPNDPGGTDVVDDPRLPRAIGEYEIVRLLGRGAMAEVLLGRTKGARGFQRDVAIKRLHPHVAIDRSAVEMFVDEARICSTLSHGNIAQIYDFGKAGSTYYIAMEYVDGPSLRDVLDDSPGAISEPVAALIVARVCEALDYAHHKRDADGKPLDVVHRDVKPSNVLISVDGQVKLIDFGVAKAAQRLHQTVGAMLKGSFAYMSPEQADAGHVDHRSDIFSVGTLLYELVTAENPFIGASSIDTLERVRHVHMVPPRAVKANIDVELERICLKALSPEPRSRYQRAGEMQRDLDRFCRLHGFGADRFARWVIDDLAHGQPCSAAQVATAEDVPLQRSDEPLRPDGTEALGYDPLLPVDLADQTQPQILAGEALTVPVHKLPTDDVIALDSSPSTDLDIGLRTKPTQALKPTGRLPSYDDETQIDDVGLPTNVDPPEASIAPIRSAPTTLDPAAFGEIAAALEDEVPLASDPPETARFDRPSDEPPVTQSPPGAYESRSGRWRVSGPLVDAPTHLPAAQRSPKPPRQRGGAKRSLASRRAVEPGRAFESAGHSMMSAEPPATHTDEVVGPTAPPTGRSALTIIIALAVTAAIAAAVYAFAL